MQSRYQQGDLTWVDIESPTSQDVRDVIGEFNIAPQIAEELLLPSGKPRAEVFQNYLYVIIHFPALRHSHIAREQEIDFIVGRNFIITAHYEVIDPLHKFSKVFEVNSAVGSNTFGEHAGFIFFYILKKLYKAVEHELEYIHRDLGTIEEHTFSGHEIEMVAAISRSARDLLNLRQTVEPHHEVLHELEECAPALFGQEFIPFLRALSNEYYRVHTHIIREIESLKELRETNNSLLTTKQNETMRVLTIMALLTFPLALLVAIFDMNAKDNPIIGHPHDFWIIVGSVLMIGSLMLLYFKHKKWL
ncbi:hypothetical protein HZC00_01270 [Candidatus Kaiserbacteria bacterium]|nr:hypothetical protein [Candidatus Kaiserbacteria bacterium]